MFTSWSIEPLYFLWLSINNRLFIIHCNATYPDIQKFRKLKNICHDIQQFLLLTNWIWKENIYFLSTRCPIILVYNQIRYTGEKLLFHYTQTFHIINSGIIYKFQYFIVNHVTMSVEQDCTIRSCLGNRAFYYFPHLFFFDCASNISIKHIKPPKIVNHMQHAKIPLTLLPSIFMYPLSFRALLLLR